MTEPKTHKDLRPDLKELLKQSKTVVMTEEEKEEQRRSWAYGNTKLSNPAITRKLVGEVADGMPKPKYGKGTVVTSKGLCKGDMVILKRCGANDKERVAKVAYANDFEFVPLVRLLGFLPIWVPFTGLWQMGEEGKTWDKIQREL